MSKHCKTWTCCSGCHSQKHPCKHPWSSDPDWCSTTFWLWCQQTYSCPEQCCTHPGRWCHHTGRSSQQMLSGRELLHLGLCSWWWQQGQQQGEGGGWSWWWSSWDGGCSWSDRWRNVSCWVEIWVSHIPFIQHEDKEWDFGWGELLDFGFAWFDGISILHFHKSYVE